MVASTSKVSIILMDRDSKWKNRVEENNKAEKEKRKNMNKKEESRKMRN